MQYYFSAFICVMTLIFGTPRQKDLLDRWPESGPKMLFEEEGIGNGYSAPAIHDNRVYVTGEIDSTGYLFAYDFDGQQLWVSEYGKEWTVSYRGSRATPTVVGDLIYVCSGMGLVSCFEAQSGAKKWSVDLIADLEGVNVTYGYAMTLVVDGDRLFCSPGGLKNNVVALNRYSGDLIWGSPAMGESAGYGAPLVIDFVSRKVLVTASEFNIMALDAGSGDLLWSYELSFKGDLPCNTPVYDGEYLYWVAGPGNGAVAAKLSTDGSEMKVVWKNPEFDTSFGGFVQINDHLYGASDRHRKYVSLDTQSGKIIKSISFGVGSISLAGDMLIAYNQRGQVGLIQANQDDLTLVSSFNIKKGTMEHFSHVVVKEDRLFIRHGNAMQVFALTNL